jgi:beta-glucosidase
MSRDEIVTDLNKKRDEICLVAMLDTLEYLKRGGRISGTVAFAGGVLNIKPVVTIKDGEILILGKARGTKKANNFLVEEIKKKAPHIKTGLSVSLHDLQALEGGEEFAKAAWEEEFSHYLPYIKDDDFLGVQNYTRTQYGPQGQLPCPEGALLTQMDYEFYPEALEHVIRRVHEEFKGDLIVSENGVAVSDDSLRVKFIETALNGVQNCLNDGIPLKGYFYWSLMDNFEWQKGFSMTFGLIAVDRSTQKRTPKESLSYLGSYTKK